MPAILFTLCIDSVLIKLKDTVVTLMELSCDHIPTQMTSLLFFRVFVVQTKSYQ